MNKSVLDKDLQRVSGLENATHDLARALAAPGIALVFLLAAAVWASFTTDGPMSYLVVIAAAIAGLNRSVWQTARIAPPRVAASISASASASEAANGFSTST